MNINKFTSSFLIFVGLSGCFSVLFGAWLAHAGQALELIVHQRLSSALHYQFLHTIALLALIVWLKREPCKLLLIPAILFVLGILLFSGSLYLKTFLPLTSFGKLAPIGGMSLALAWASLIIVGIKNK